MEVGRRTRIGAGQENFTCSERVGEYASCGILVAISPSPVPLLRPSDRSAIGFGGDGLPSTERRTGHRVGADTSRAQRSGAHRSSRKIAQIRGFLRQHGGAQLLLRELSERVSSRNASVGGGTS